MSERLVSTATVTVTLDIDLTQGWSEQATLAEVFRQAEKDAASTLRKFFDREKNVNVKNVTNIKVIQHTIKV